VNLVKKKLYLFRAKFLDVWIISNLLGKLWFLIPNPLRLRLPVKSIGYGFISLTKIFKWTLDPRDSISQKYFGYGFRRYEPCTQRALFREIQNLSESKEVSFLNIGANTGLYALLVGKKFPDSTITLIEPVPLNLQFLRANMDLNNLNPEIFEFAASDSNGVVTICNNEEFFGLASISENSSTPLEVRTAQVDDIINKKVDVVLIDVEGHEMKVLKGMSKILKDSKPSLIIETNSETLGNLSAYLETYGYLAPVWLGRDTLFGPQEKNFLFKQIP